MTKNSVQEFEDKRWKGGDQTPVFRHTEAVRMVAKGQKVLDIGCGDGLLLEALTKKGALVSGVDISEEGFPRVVLEAMASGVPIVGSDVGSVLEIVPDSMQSYIIEPKDTSGFVKALDDILSNTPEETAEIKTKLIARAKEFEIATVAKKFATLFII